jgi:hypothetical protein
MDFGLLDFTSKNIDGTYLSYKDFANIVGSEILCMREQEYENDPNEQCLLYKLWKNFGPLDEKRNEVVKYSTSTQPLTENVIIEELKEIPTNEESSNWDSFNINDIPIMFLTGESTLNQLDTVETGISRTDTKVRMSRTENQECFKNDTETGVKSNERVQDCSISLKKTLSYAKTPIRKGKRASEASKHCEVKFKKTPDTYLLGIRYLFGAELGMIVFFMLD